MDIYKSTEITVHQLNELRQENAKIQIIDVREDREWIQGHIPGAIHLGKGIIERDIEKVIEDKESLIVLYCQGGYRSALAGENLKKMGYEKILSMQGGFGDWVNNKYPVEVPN